MPLLRLSKSRKTIAQQLNKHAQIINEKATAFIMSLKKLIIARDALNGWGKYYRPPAGLGITLRGECERQRQNLTNLPVAPPLTVIGRGPSIL